MQTSHRQKKTNTAFLNCYGRPISGCTCCHHNNAVIIICILYYTYTYYEDSMCSRFSGYLCYGVSVLNIDLKTDNLDRISIPRKIVATFDVEHPIHGTTYGPK